MAQQSQVCFKSIQLLKDQTLGIGSYGIVCKALCDGLICAAKVIHQTLFDPNAHQRIERNKEHRLPIQRFMQECEFMSTIRHPNIIQFLGTHQDPQTGLPVLLMELMDDSLTHFLESSQDAVPYHIQVNFCQDITLAISYLHCNGITHRDLSSNNVLLYGTVKAKVTDFGMAKLEDLNPQATRVSFTMCPGTDVYMPPEAVKDKPIYTEKIDCFAIGTLIIQILTRCFPDPGDRLKVIQLDHSQYPSGSTVYMPVPEIERRQNHISLVDPKHPLLPIALDCLKDSDVQRPSAQELCHRVAALKETLHFTESMTNSQERVAESDIYEMEKEELLQKIRDKDDIIEQKDEEICQLKEKHAEQILGLQYIIRSQNSRLDDTTQHNSEITKQKDDMIQERQLIVEKDRRLHDIIREKDQLIQEKEKHIHRVTEELESNQQVMAQFQTRMQELEQQLKRKTETLTITDEKLNTKPILRDTHTLLPLESKASSATATGDSSTPSWKELPSYHPYDTVKQVTAQLQPQIQNSKQEQLKRKMQTEVLQSKPQPSLRAIPKPPPSDTSTTTATGRKSRFTLQKWRAGKKAPCEMRGVKNAVVHGDVVYFSCFEKHNIYAYKSREEKWNKLHECEAGGNEPTIAVVNDLLTIIGGQNKHGVITNELFSLTGEGWNKKWKEVFPPMPTERKDAIAACTGLALIVAGGSTHVGFENKTAVVEVMDIETQQWSSAADLPEPLHMGSAMVLPMYGEPELYIFGDYNTIIYTCRLTDLFISCQSRSLGERLAYAQIPSYRLDWVHLGISENTWSKFTQAPDISRFTCVAIQNQMLAIGGYDGYQSRDTSNVREYTGEYYIPWRNISSMMTRRSNCFAAVLPTNELMVVGGSDISKTDSVEIASIKLD